MPNFKQLKQLAVWSWDPGRRAVTLTAIAAVLWVLLWCDWTAWYLLPTWLHSIGFTAALGVAAYWLHWPRGCERTLYRGILSACFIPVWGWLTFASFTLGWYGLGKFFTGAGIATAFVIGLCWAVWYVERRSRFYEALAREDPNVRSKRWNPLDLAAWYYGARRKRLDQSALTLVSYCFSFLLVLLIAGQISGCREIYESPFGGGKPKKIQQIVKIQQVIKRKFVINPYSSVIFNPPKIEDIKLQILKVTDNKYRVGYGDDPGAGFATGTARGKVRFIRLEYSGGDWDQDLERNADLNMLLQYGIRTTHRVADRNETRKISQLKNFPARKSPPFVYITGQRELPIGKGDQGVLREYLTEKHGLLFADNGGSGGWGGQFIQLMSQVLPTVEPKTIPLDHPIHRVPYEIPFLPYVAPHGGKDAIGWTVEGRLVAYYHPGDIGDAWADGHAGVSRKIAEYCYQTGVNVMFYAHAEYHKWLTSLEEEERQR